METHRHCSTLASLPPEPNTVLGPMYAARFHTMISLSSPPEAKYIPPFDHRTQFTHAK